MADFSWSDLCDSGDEDDEDYDPLKDPTLLHPPALEDSDSDSFEGLRHLLSPKRGRSGGRGGGGTGGGVGGAGGSGGSGGSGGVRARSPGGSGSDAEGSADAAPVAQAHWHTRTQGKLPDDVWTQTDSLLEKAEMVLDPLSPGAQSDTFQNEMLANCTNPEYLRLLAVARGEREPEEDEDEEDADFVPDEEEDAEGTADKTDDEARLSVSNAELSALIADNRSTSAAAAAAASTKAAAAGSSPGRACAGVRTSGEGKEAAGDDAGKAARARRRRRDKKKSSADSVVRVLPFAESGGLLPFADSAAGFSHDQCIQLRVCLRPCLLAHAALARSRTPARPLRALPLFVASTPAPCLTLSRCQGQMRQYLQLAAQQYVLNCCLPDKDEPARSRDIQQLHTGLAEMYQNWEVSKEYCAMQSKAMNVLTQWVLGGESAVQTVEEPRFTFFDIPGISLVPSLLETVSQQCSNCPAPANAAGSSSASAHSAAGGQPGVGGQMQAMQDDEACDKVLEKCGAILGMFGEHFEDSIKLPASRSAAPEHAAAGGPGGFTPAEDALLLNGLKRFGCENSAWEKIKVHVLPTKQTEKLKARYRNLTKRSEESNDVKTWKLSLSEGLSKEEEDLLHKSVQYFGTRFDLISAKVFKNKNEEELRKAYAKLISKHTRDANPRPGSCRQAPAASGVPAPQHSHPSDDRAGAADGQGSAPGGEMGGAGGAGGGATSRRAPAKKRGFNKDLLAGGSPPASKRRRVHMVGHVSSRVPMAPLANQDHSTAGATAHADHTALAADADADDDDYENEVRACACARACTSACAFACACVRGVYACTLFRVC